MCATKKFSLQENAGNAADNLHARRGRSSIVFDIKQSASIYLLCQLLLAALVALIRIYPRDRVLGRAGEVQQQLEQFPRRVSSEFSTLLFSCLANISHSISHM